MIRKVTPGGVVTTLAGLAGEIYPGSTDGTGSAAQFYYPQGIAVDGAGNVYVADSGNNTIRKVTPDGVVTTLAGLAGSYGSTDGTGTAAEFSYPTGVAVDGAGNVYVADRFNNTIRKVTPNGVVTTLAGLVGSSGSTDATGSDARFNEPVGVAVDGAGNIYVADSRNNTIRQVTPGGVATTLAGLAGSSGSTDATGSAARFNDPQFVAVDGAGNAYVADTENHTIRKVTPDGVVTTLAGLAGSSGSTDSTGSAARFSSPSGVAVDGTGNVYLADTYNHTIRKVTPGGVVTTLAGLAGGPGSTDSTGIAARFNRPGSVAVDGAGNVYVADTGNNTIRKGVPGGPVGSPVITAPPQSQVTAAASDVAFYFTVIDTGNGLTYQWRKGIVDLPGATNAMLALTNVMRAASGAYSVVVTGSAGSTPSSDATLRVIVPQRVEGGTNLHRLPDGRFQLHFRDPDGTLASDLSRFEIHSTTNLIGAGTIWETNTTVLSIINGLIRFEDAGSTNLLRRFYRVIER